jgi:hypothetical protein
MLNVFFTKTNGKLPPRQGLKESIPLYDPLTNTIHTSLTISNVLTLYLPTI